MKSRDKKGEDGDIWIYVCGGEKTREKKKKKRMDERKEKNKKWTLEILSQYFHNKF